MSADISSLRVAAEELRVAVEEAVWHSVIALMLFIYAAAVGVFIVLFPVFSAVRYVGVRAAPLRGVVGKIMCWRRGL